MTCFTHENQKDNLVKILRVKKTPLFDVFIGDGWDQWSRVLFDKGKTITIAGEKLASFHHLMVHRQLKKLLNGPKQNAPVAPQNRQQAA